MGEILRRQGGRLKRVFREILPATGEACMQVTEHVCIACGESTSLMTSVLGKLIVGFGSSERIESNNYLTLESKLFSVETVKTLHFPRFKTGRVCQECYDRLSGVRYTNSRGVLSPVITALKDNLTSMSSESERVFVARKDHNVIGPEAGRTRPAPDRFTSELIDKE